MLAEVVGEKKEEKVKEMFAIVVVVEKMHEEVVEEVEVSRPTVPGHQPEL